MQTQSIRVRMKHRETPLFLEVGALSPSHDFEIHAEAGAGQVSNISNWGCSSAPAATTRPVPAINRSRDIQSARRWQPPGSAKEASTTGR